MIQYIKVVSISPILVGYINILNRISQIVRFDFNGPGILKKRCVTYDIFMTHVHCDAIVTDFCSENSYF